jgi:hypothetical protein
MASPINPAGEHKKACCPKNTVRINLSSPSGLLVSNLIIEMVLR